MTLVGDFVTGKPVPFQRMRFILEQLGIVEGIADAGDLAVTQRAAGANMTVDVAAGEAWVKIDSGTRNGLAHVVNDAVANVAIAPSHATLPRVDAVVLQYNDTAIPAGVGGDTPTLRPLQGVATAGATLANLTGAPAIPNDALLLGFVLVPAAATSVLTTNIGGYFKPWLPAAGAVAGAPPAYAAGYPISAPRPAWRAFRSLAAYGVANGVLSPILADSVRWDDGGNFAGGTNYGRTLVKYPGKWQFGGWLNWDLSAAASVRKIHARINGGFNVSSDGVPGINTDFAQSHAIESSYQMGFGEYMEIHGYQSTGGTINIQGGEVWATFLGR